eukprot:gene1850-33271_t
MLPADLVAFWSSVSKAPWSIFLDDNREDVQKNLKATAKLLLQYPPPSNTRQDFLAGIELLSSATTNVDHLVTSRGKVEEREASVVLRRVDTVQAIVDLIAATKACGSGLLARMCLTWLHPTMMKVERHGSGLGTRPGLRLCEGTNLAHTCMDLLKWAISMTHIRDLDGIIFETIGMMGQSIVLMQQACPHPNFQYLQAFARPELMKPRPSNRVVDFAKKAGPLLIRRMILRSDDPVCGDMDYVLLEELADLLEEAERCATGGPPLTPAQRLALLFKGLKVGRSALIKSLERAQATLRKFCQNGGTFDIESITSQACGLKGEWMTRDNLQSKFRKQLSTGWDQQVYCSWSSQHVYNQLTKGNQDVANGYSSFGEWERVMASCVSFGPAGVAFSPGSKLPGRDVRPWVDAFIQLPMEEELDRSGWNIAMAMTSDRRLMRLFVFANMAVRAACTDKYHALQGTRTAAGSDQEWSPSPAVYGTRTAAGSNQERSPSSAVSPSPAVAPSPTISPSPAVPPSQAATETAVSPSLAAPLTHGGRYACDSCKARFENKKDVKRCSICKTARYCSAECQTRDWKEGGHKARCKLVTARGSAAPAACAAVADAVQES